MTVILTAQTLYNAKYNSMYIIISTSLGVQLHHSPESKVHGANMGPTWVLSAPDGTHVGPMNLALREITRISLKGLMMDARHRGDQRYPDTSDPLNTGSFDQNYDQVQFLIFLNQTTSIGAKMVNARNMTRMETEMSRRNPSHTCILQLLNQLH